MKNSALTKVNQVFPLKVQITIVFDEFSWLTKYNTKYLSITQSWQFYVQVRCLLIALGCLGSLHTGIDSVQINLNWSEVITGGARSSLDAEGSAESC